MDQFGPALLFLAITFAAWMVMSKITSLDKRVENLEKILAAAPADTIDRTAPPPDPGRN